MTDHPEFPDAMAVFGGTDGQLSMHGFDSRGVYRVLAVSLSEGTWRFSRDAPAPDFSQRFTGTFSDDANTITFTNTDDPNASSISLLFFRGETEAREAARRVEEDIESEAERQREQGLEPGKVAPPKVRGNAVILDEPTEAQSRVLDDCLDQSAADA